MDHLVACKATEASQLVLLHIFVIYDEVTTSEWAFGPTTGFVSPELFQRTSWEKAQIATVREKEKRISLAAT